MKKARKIHDGMVGAVVVLGVLLGMYVAVEWLWLPLILGIVLIQSAVTGFCPVYYILDRCVDESCCNN